MQWIKGWVWGNSMLNVNQSTHTFYFSWPKWDVSSINQIQYAFQLEPNVEILTQDRETKELLYFPKVKSAKTCLALPEAVIEPIKYRGSFEMDTLMQFINEKAETHRQLDGKLTLHGETIEYLNNNRYTVEPNDVCSRISASELNSTRFLTDFVKRNRPVIITDALQYWPQVTEWTTDYLRQRIGSHPVHVKLSPNGQFEGCEPLSGWENHENPIPQQVKQALVSSDLVLVRPATMEVSFEQFLNRFGLSNDSDTALYLEYLSMAAYLPELQSDTPVFPFAAALDLKIRNLWYTTSETIGKLHFDPYENLISILSGVKTFELYDPSDNTRLYEGHLREGLLEYDAARDVFMRRDLMESTSMVNSPVDPISPDLARFPRFQNATPLTCRVEENETLFVPSFWWHEVNSEKSLKSERNVAVNLWFEPFFTKEYPCPTCPMQVNSYYENFSEW